MRAAPRNDEARWQAGNEAQQKTLSQKNSGQTPKAQGGIDALLNRLDRVKKTGPNTWLASCPTREDRNPSLSVRELDDGRILLHDHGGDGVAEILGAIGMTFSDLYPRKTGRNYLPERRPFPCADAFRAVAFEGTIIALAGAAIIAGEPFSQFDKDRLLIAVGRINDALSAAGVAHG